MHVEVGPVPSSSVIAWISYAEMVLGVEHLEDADHVEQGEQVRVAVPDEVPAAAADVPVDAVAAFQGYLDEWWRIAQSGPEFTWTADIAGEVAEYLVLAFYRVVRRLNKAAEARQEVLAPAEGELFYNTLVDRLLSALADEGPGPAEFAEHLRSFWPGASEP